MTTYADRAKSIMNRYKLRLGDKFDKGDKLAQEAMEQELTQLQQEQEKDRVSKLSLRERLGMKLAERAKGGMLPMYSGPGTFSQFLPQTNNAFGNSLGNNTGFNLFNPDTYGTGVGNFNTDFSGGGAGPGGAAPFSLGPTEGLSGLSTAGASSQVNNFDNLGDFSGGFKSRVPWWGALAQAGSSILANKQINFADADLDYNFSNYQPSTYKAAKTSANLVDYSRDREQTGRERDIANAAITSNARGSSSQAGLMENILAGVTSTQRGAGQQFASSLQNEGNMNAQIKTQTAEQNAARQAQASQFNAAQRAQANQMNMQNQQFATSIAGRNDAINRENMLINQGRRDAQILGVGNAITGYGKDLMAANQYDQMVNMMAPDNYKLGTGDDKWWKKMLGISPDMVMNFLNTGDKTT